MDGDVRRGSWTGRQPSELLELNTVIGSMLETNCLIEIYWQWATAHIYLSGELAHSRVWDIRGRGTPGYEPFFPSDTC